MFKSHLSGALLLSCHGHAVCLYLILLLGFQKNRGRETTSEKQTVRHIPTHYLVASLADDANSQMPLVNHSQLSYILKAPFRDIPIAYSFCTSCGQVAGGQVDRASEHVGDNTGYWAFDLRS